VYTASCWEPRVNKAGTFPGPGPCCRVFTAGPSPPVVPSWPSRLHRWSPLLWSWSRAEPAGWLCKAGARSFWNTRCFPSLRSWQAVLQVANLSWQPCYPHPLQRTQKGAEMEDAWKKHVLLSQRLVLITSGGGSIANKLDASSFYFLRSSWNRH